MVKIIDDRKKCSKCKKFFNFDCYSKDTRNKCGLSSQCKKCKVKNEKIRSNIKKHNITKEEYLNNKNKYKKICKSLKDKKEYAKNRTLKRLYNIDLYQFSDMLLEQNSKCKICSFVFNNNITPHVDHCHKTNKIRGLLCRHCNQGLGHFKDNTEILKSAISYLN